MSPCPALDALQRISADPPPGTLNAGVPSREYLADRMGLVQTILLVHMAHKRPSSVQHTPRLARIRKPIDAFVTERPAARMSESGSTTRPMLTPIHDLEFALHPAGDRLTKFESTPVFTPHSSLRFRFARRADSHGGTNPESGNC